MHSPPKLSKFATCEIDFRYLASDERYVDLPADYSLRDVTRGLPTWNQIHIVSGEQPCCDKGK